MTFDRNVGGHAFDGQGGRCQKCDMTWAAYIDKDSKNFKRPCPGRKTEPQERMAIED
jgi:hypothetical protein